MKKFFYNTQYRGTNLLKTVCAKSMKSASEKLEISLHYLKNYVSSIEIKSDSEYFEGVNASYNSGDLLKKRPDLFRKEMPYLELKSIIDEIKDAEWKQYLDNLEKK